MVNGDCGTAEIGQATHDRLALISKFSHFSATRRTWWFIPMMRTIISPISAARWISTESLSHPTDEVRELKIHFPTHDENEQKNWFRKRLTRAGDKFHVSLRAFAVARKRRRFKIADHKLEHNCRRGATRNELMGWKRLNRNSKSQPRGKLAASSRFPSRRGIWLSDSLRVIKGPIYMRAIKLCGLQSANTEKLSSSSSRPICDDEPDYDVELFLIIMQIRALFMARRAPRRNEWDISKNSFRFAAFHWRGANELWLALRAQGMSGGYFRIVIVFSCLFA